MHDCAIVHVHRIRPDSWLPACFHCLWTCMRSNMALALVLMANHASRHGTAPCAQKMNNHYQSDHDVCRTDHYRNELAMRSTLPVSRSEDRRETQKQTTK